jgi:hypothetical protein
MGKGKSRKRGYGIDDTVGDHIQRITDRPERDPMGHIEARISGPKHFFREPDSVHIVEFRTGTDRKSYRNSVPLTTVELQELRQTITDWLDDE